MIAMSDLPVERNSTGCHLEGGANEMRREGAGLKSLPQAAALTDPADSPNMAGACESTPKKRDFLAVNDVYVYGNTSKPEEYGNTVDVDGVDATKIDFSARPQIAEYGEW